MTGFDRLKEQIKDQEDMALKQVIQYLLSRDDLEPKYLNEEKSVEGMRKFIKDKGTHHARNGWSFVTDGVVCAWAVMYFTLPNSFLKIQNTPKSSSKKETTKTDTTTKNNVISIEKAKEKQTEQLSLFGGANNDKR